MSLLPNRKRLLAGAGMALLLFFVVFPAMHATPVAHAEDGTALVVAQAVLCASGSGCGAFFANAQAIISWILYIIIWILLTLGSFVLALGGWFLELVLALNTQIVNAPPIHFGYSVSLAFANLGFVFAITLIAIMTMLRVQSYSAKNLLVKVVAAAIAVNFGLIIAGTLINFSDSISLYLMRSSLPNAGADDSITSSQFATAIAGVVEPQRNWIMTNTTANKEQVSISSSAGGLLGAISGIMLAAVFLWTTALIIWGVIGMLLLRYVWMVILLVLMPFIWLMWIFPQTKSMYSNWWHKFVKWTFFAPVLFFFLYLAIQTAQVISATGGKVSGDQFGFITPDKGGTAGFFTKLGGDFLKEFVESRMPALIVMTLMVGGLIAANKVGDGVAKGTLGAATGFLNSTKGWMKNKAVGAGQKGGRMAGDRLRTVGTREDGTTAIQRGGSFLATIPGFGKIGAIIAKQGTKAATERKEDVETYRKSRLESLDTNSLIKLARSRTIFADKLEAAGVAQELANRKLLDPRNISYGPGGMPADLAARMPRFVQDAQQMGTVQSILDSRPDLAIHQANLRVPVFGTGRTGVTRAANLAPISAANPTNDIDSVIGVAIGKGKEAEKYGPQLFAPVGGGTPDASQISNTLSLEPRNIARMASEGDVNLISAVRNTLDYVHAHPAWGAAIDPVAAGPRMSGTHPSIIPDRATYLLRRLPSLVKAVNRSTGFQNIP